MGFGNREIKQSVIKKKSQVDIDYQYMRTLRVSIHLLVTSINTLHLFMPESRIRHLPLAFVFQRFVPRKTVLRTIIPLISHNDVYLFASTCACRYKDPVRTIRTRSYGHTCTNRLTPCRVL